MTALAEALLAASDRDLREALATTVRVMHERGWTTEQIEDAVNDGHGAYFMDEHVKGQSE